jgi:small subunit ribosomal protein S16
LAVKIRLRRVGARKRPFYRLVVADARSPRDGRFIEAVGTYDPLQNPALVKVDAERVLDWISKGARPTDIARQLLVAEGVLEHTGPRYEKIEKAPPLSKKRVAKARAAEAEVAGEAGAETAPVAEAKPSAEAPLEAGAATAPVGEGGPPAEAPTEATDAATVTEAEPATGAPVEATDAAPVTPAEPSAEAPVEAEEAAPDAGAAAEAEAAPVETEPAPVAEAEPVVGGAAGGEVVEPKSEEGAK